MTQRSSPHLLTVGLVQVASICGKLAKMAENVPVLDDIDKARIANAAYDLNKIAAKLTEEG